MLAMALRKPSQLCSGAIASDMVSMPTNSTPSPISTSPKAPAVVYFFGRKVSSRPTQAKIMPKSSFTDSISDVTVVPTFAPIITPTACVSDKRPAFTKPTTMTVVAEEDWITAVMATPASIASTRLCVTIPRIFFSRLPAARSSPSPMTFMPNRKRLSPPSRLMIFMTDMRYPSAHFLSLFTQTNSAYHEPQEK